MISAGTKLSFHIAFYRQGVYSYSFEREDMKEGMFNWHVLEYRLTMLDHVVGHVLSSQSWQTFYLYSYSSAYLFNASLLESTPQTL